ncbi:MAG: hypothetical protein HC846_12835, partial [Blastocatellia bacterium]|nr:hypothetical protein [Blastocatellia bacterium]
MEQNLTIYAAEECEKIRGYLETLEMKDVSNGESDMDESDQSDLQVKTFEKQFDEGLLRVSLKKRFENGDSFSRIIGGTWNFFRMISTENEKQKKELLTRILECKTAIGIKAIPLTTLTDKRLDFVFDLME